MLSQEVSPSAVSLPISFERLVPVVLECAAQAADRVRAGQYQIDLKPDNSYVTTIDIAAHDFLVENLPRNFNALVISEEGIPDVAVRQSVRDAWIIDPIDNTKGLVAGRNLDRSNINVVLVRDGVPVLGLVYYFADARGYIAIEGQGNREFSPEGISEIARPERSLNRSFVTYRRELSQMTEVTRRAHELALEQGDEIVYRDLLPLRLRALIQGAADVYIEPRSLYEWDVAPAFAAMTAIGGQGISLLDGRPIRLNSLELKVPPFILARPGVDAQDIFRRIHAGGVFEPT